MKVNSSRNPYVISDVKWNDTLAIPCILIGGINVSGNGQLRSKCLEKGNKLLEDKLELEELIGVEFPVIHQPPQATGTEMLQARENLMEAIQAFLKEYDHIPPKEKCMALLLAEERFLKIKQAVEEEQNQPEVMQELLLKHMNDLQILNGIQPKQEKQAEQEEPVAQSFLLNWNFPMVGDEYTILYRSTKAITPDLPIEEPDNSLSMGDEHLSTIPEIESDKLIKSSVENLVLIPSEAHVVAEGGLIDSLFSRDILIILKTTLMKKKERLI
ncbi:hypothetical protein Tco_0445692, partial [Tanacetum coccineum]